MEFVLLNVICGVMTSCILYGSVQKSYPFCSGRAFDSVISLMMGLLGAVGLVAVIIAVLTHPTTTFGFKVPFTK